jgi:hypothetical protein
VTAQVLKESYRINSCISKIEMSPKSSSIGKSLMVFSEWGKGLPKTIIYSRLIKRRFKKPREGIYREELYQDVVPTLV